MSSAGRYKAVARNELGAVETVVSELEVDLKPKIVALFEAGNTRDSCELIETENSSVDLEFKLEGKPEPTVSYYKDDAIFKASEKRVLLTKKENNTYKFTIPELKTNDAGIYKINAKNTSAVSSFLIELKIKAAPKLVKILKNKMECVENSKVELTCSVAPGIYPAPEFKWFRNDEELVDENEQSMFVILKDDKANTLLIDKVTLGLDANKFKFVSSNELGSCETETLLEVSSLPKFNIDIVDAEPYLMQAFEWNFEVDANPEPKSLKILRNDKEINLSRENRIRLTSSSEIKNERRVTSYKLAFEKTLAEDLGFYKIEAANKAGQALTQAQLTVKGGPCFIRKPVDTSFVVNKPVKVEFEISGIPDPEVVWLKNGEPFAENERVKIDNKVKTSFTFSIKTCSKEDAGVYTIKLTNENGKAEESFNLSLQSEF